MSDLEEWAIMGIEARARIASEARARVKVMNFGDPVTNICAGNNNPNRLCFFVEYVLHSRKNRWGIIHCDYFAKCTDRKGKFWDISIDVIYPGHLDAEECKRLFHPVWQANYGQPKESCKAEGQP